MKKLSALEENHVYCQICGAEMRKDTDQAPSTFSRQTGAEIAGAKTYWWRCPLWTPIQPHNQHDCEVWVP